MPQDIEDEISLDLLKKIHPLKALGVILLISAAIFLFLVWLIYFKESGGTSSELVSSLPAVNALLNGTSAVLLLLGYRAIRRGRYITHMRFNLTAFFTSALFLISYVIYHNFHGHTPFPGQGFIRPVYFTILISHIILSALLMPMILTSFYLAFSGKIKKHRKVSKITLPVWLYVSVTGVAIFVLLNLYV